MSLNIFKAMVENSADWLMWLDENQQPKYISPAVENITGYKAQDLINNPALISKIIHPEDRDVLKKFKHEFNNPNECSTEFRIIHKDGSVHWISHQCRPIFDEQNRIIGRISSNRDITERKQLENSLRENNELLRALINSTPDIICFKDGQGRWQEANIADLKLFQLEQVDYRGKKDSELAKYSPFYYDAFMTCETTDEKAWQKGTISRGIEIIPKPDGTEKVYDVIKVPLFEKDGSRKGLVVLGRDITEMKKAEDELKNTIKLLTDERRLFTAGPVVVFKWRNASGWPVEYVSENVQEVFGYSSEEFLSGKVAYVNLIHKEDVERVAEEVRTYTEKGAEAFHHKPYRIIHKNGQIVWLLDNTIIIRNESDQITHYFGYVVDITEQKQNEQKIRTHLQRMNLLQKTIVNLNRKQSLEEILHLAVDGVVELLNADRAAVLLYEDDQKVHFKAWRNLSETYRKKVDGHSPWRPDEIYAKPITIDDIDHSDLIEEIREALHKEGIQALMFVPLLQPKGLIGKFMVYFDASHHFNQDEINLATVFAQNLASLIVRQKALEAALQSQRKYKDIFDHAAEGIYQSTPDGKFIAVNPALVKMFGYQNAEQMLAIKNTAQLYWDEKERQRLVKLANKEGLLNNVEVKMKRFDGSPFWALINERTIKDEQGNILYYEGTLVDITQRKRFEEELILREKYQAIQNNLLKISLENIPLQEKLKQALNIILTMPSLDLQMKGGIFLADNESKVLILKVHYNLPFALLEKCSNVTFGECLCGLAAEQKEIQYAACLDERHSIRYYGIEPHGHYNVPVLSGNELLGVLVVYLEENNEENENIRSYLLSIADTLATLIVHAKTDMALNQQLTFSRALNTISSNIILEQDRAQLLTQMAQIAGETLQLDRSLIYEIDLKKREAKALCEWLNPKVEDLTSTAATYPLNLFEKSAAYVTTSRQYLESHLNKIHPLISAEGSDKLLHEQMSIKSLLWFPFAFSDDKYYLLVYNHTQRLHKWQKAEIEFTESLSKLIEMGLMKIKFLEEQARITGELRRLATVVEQASTEIIITDKEGNIQYVNPAFERITGYKFEEVIGQNPKILKSDKHSPEFYQKLWDTILSGKVWQGVFQNRKKNGQILIERTDIFPIFDEKGEITNFAAVKQDITKESMLEAQLQQAQKMESIGTLAGGIAHDFNNLLTVINGYAELALKNLSEDNPLSKKIKMILEAGKRAQNLTSQLLAFSRKQVYKIEILNINQIISSMDKMLRRLIGEDITVETYLASELPNVKADASQLEQILLNLVVNARDALHQITTPTYQKKITIETGMVYLDKNYVETHAGSKKGRYVFFSVSDNGIGMDEETQKRIFEPFFTTKGKFKGTGLGLSTVYGIVKQNKGYINVYSEPGHGTTFKIYWPATDEKEQKVNLNKIEKIKSGNETILVVEDEDNVRHFAVESLTSLGYKVYQAVNGRVALEMINKQKLKIDLIITDLVMPELNGKEFVENVKKIYPDIKVIYVSGYAENHIISDGMLHNGINFIQKPYSINTLALTVRKVLEQRS